MPPLREFSPTLARIAARYPPPRLTIITSRVSYFNQNRRHASNNQTPLPVDQAVAEEFKDLEPQSSFNTEPAPESLIANWDPIKRARARKRQLPASRYQFRPPRYDRGPLHPHQSPPETDPSSRLFVPGPFLHSRLEQTFRSTVAPDLMTLAYKHVPPGTVKPVKAPRLREWDDSSPYHKNRPKRGPRGGDVLRLLEPDITFRYIPKIEGVTVHCMTKKAMSDSAYLHVAGILLQAVTGVRPTVHRVKHTDARFGIREGKPISLTCDLQGVAAWEFVDKCVNLVFPKIKDWLGVKSSSGDGSGNVSFGFSRESVALFPEIEINYDMYPPKMIPGFHVTVKTTARSDRHAKLLLSSLGMPFHGDY